MVGVSVRIPICSQISSFPVNHQGVFWLALLFLAHTTQTHKTNESMFSLTTQQKALFAQNSAEFAVDLFGILQKDNPHENIVFSPFTIQACLALARIGAAGETAQELDQGLRLISSDVAAIAESFSSVLTEYANSDLLKIVNRIYVMQGYHIRQDFQGMANSKFLADAETIDFGRSEYAAAKINEWVASKTNSLITNVVPANALTNDTRMVLLNAIHFKGQWLYKFDKEDTQDEDFYLNESDSVRVPMMSLRARFLYSALPELDATALEMPYKNSDLSMLIILPNSRSGLQSLQDKLKNVTLSEITEQMYEHRVNVKFPKFKTEFSVELKDPLEKLGMQRLFSSKAQLGNLLDDAQPVEVSKVIHKAFIEVNEEGTEAAAATVMHVRNKRSLNTAPNPKEFNADHPFLYVVYHATKSSSDSGEGSALQKVVLFVGSLSVYELFSLPPLLHNEL